MVNQTEIEDKGDEKDKEKEKGKVQFMIKDKKPYPLESLFCCFCIPFANIGQKLVSPKGKMAMHVVNFLLLHVGS